MTIKRTQKIKNNIQDKTTALGYSEASNPMMSKYNVHSLSLNNYKQELPRPKYDSDIAEIIELVRILNNLVPIRMPQYNFNIDEINGEHYNKPDGTPLLIREYDSDVIRDYYVNLQAKNKKYSVSRILEHDKNTGRLRVKIEPTVREGSNVKINITIFDEKINNKYVLIQLAEDGIVNNITEFSGIGKSFRTLFRNQFNSKPVRYLEGKDNINSEFEMVDCLFDSEGQVARIKRYTNKKEINIEYSDDKKNIYVKNKD
ncbi:MAG: hypothetical protein MJ231_04255 [bacterium]|nr:hypothetical protein [bacterium]